MPRKKRKHPKRHFHLTAWMIFLAVVLVSILAFCIFVSERKNNLKTPNFDDYKVSENFSGRMPAINYSSDNIALNYKNQIEEQAKKGVNFAGHFVLALWSCGQNCETGAIISALNGNIYDLPIETTCGIDFRKDSKLLILNSGADCAKDSKAAKPRYFVFGG